MPLFQEEDDFCGIAAENMDFSLFEATLASFQTKSLIPILKEELKLKIQANRLASGKEELPKPVFKEPEKFEVNFGIVLLHVDNYVGIVRRTRIGQGKH